MFRGLSWDVMGRFALPGTAAFWAIAHGLPALLLPVFLAGLVIGELRRRTDSLWPGMGVHMVTNAIALAGRLADRLTRFVPLDCWAMDQGDDPAVTEFRTKITATDEQLVALVNSRIELVARPARTQARARLHHRRPRSRTAACSSISQADQRRAALQ